MSNTNNNAFTGGMFGNGSNTFGLGGSNNNTNNANTGVPGNQQNQPGANPSNQFGQTNPTNTMFGVGGLTNPFTANQNPSGTNPPQGTLNNPLLGNKPTGLFGHSTNSSMFNLNPQNQQNINPSPFTNPQVQNQPNQDDPKKNLFSTGNANSMPQGQKQPNQDEPKKNLFPTGNANFNLNQQPQSNISNPESNSSNAAFNKQLSFAQNSSQSSGESQQGLLFGAKNQPVENPPNKQGQTNLTFLTGQTNPSNLTFGFGLNTNTTSNIFGKKEEQPTSNPSASTENQKPAEQIDTQKNQTIQNGQNSIPSSFPQVKPAENKQVFGSTTNTNQNQTIFSAQNLSTNQPKDPNVVGNFLLKNPEIPSQEKKPQPSEQSNAPLFGAENKEKTAPTFGAKPSTTLIPNATPSSGSLFGGPKEELKTEQKEPVGLSFGGLKNPSEPEKKTPPTLITNPEQKDNKKPDISSEMFSKKEEKKEPSQGILI